MLEKIAKLDSLVLRALLVAAVGLIGTILGSFGVSTELFSKQAALIIDALMNLLAAGGLAYAAYARVYKPNPPLSDAAVEKTEQMIADGKLVEVPKPREE